VGSGVGGSIMDGEVAGRIGVSGQGGQPGGAGEDSGAGTGGSIGASGTSGLDPIWCEGGGEYSKAWGGYRCESTESYAQGPNYEKVEGATTLDECFAACNARSDCTAVSDYFEMRPYSGCELVYSSCDSLTRPLSAEENGAMSYEKVCDMDGCTFERIPGFYECGQDLPPGVALDGAESLDDCKAVCLDDPFCTGVADYFYGFDVPGCYLNVGSCDAPYRSFQDGTLYVKCE
jgi:hypothetical protein